MRAIVSLFMSISGSQIERIVLSEFQDIKLSLQSSLDSENSSSMTKIEIFLYLALPFSSFYFSYLPLAGLSLWVTSPSKHILEPMFIFLNESARYCWGDVFITFLELHFFRFFWTFLQNVSFLKNSFKKSRTFQNSSCQSAVESTVF